jgi:hypothetical protein
MLGERADGGLPAQGISHHIWPGRWTTTRSIALTAAQLSAAAVAIEVPRGPVVDRPRPGVVGSRNLVWRQFSPLVPLGVSRALDILPGAKPLNPLDVVAWQAGHAVEVHTVARTEAD